MLKPPAAIDLIVAISPEVLIFLYLLINMILYITYIYICLLRWWESYSQQQ